MIDRRPRHANATLAILATLAMLALSALGVSVAQAAPPEKPNTESATGVTATEATLHGELNPGSSATAGYDFTYATPGPTCEGTTTPTETEKTGEAIKVQQLVKELIPSSEYSFCVVATHEEAGVSETASGEPLTFKTLASKPALDAQSASAITPFAATLEAQINPENQATTACTFEYGTLTVGENTTPCNPETLEGFGDQGLTAAISGLSPATIYKYRIVVENATGTTEGTEQEFETLTLEKPIVGAESTTAVSSTGATLQANVNPNYQETTYSFEYASNEALTGAVIVNGEFPLPAEFAELSASVPTGALTPRTTYYYRVLATNASGTSEGSVEHFTTTGVPILTTAAALSITRTSAVLSGTVNPGGEPTTYHFVYSTVADYQPGALNPYFKGLSTPQGTSIGADFTVHAAGPATVSELRPATTYHYAIVATNSVGATIGPDVSFTTSPPTPALAATGEASAVSQLSATLNGSLDTRGLPTVAQFEFGTVPGVGTLVPGTVTPGAGSTATLSASFNGALQPGVTYYYRALATNVDGTGYGEERSFTTPAFPGQAAAPGVVSLVAWPGFVLKELAAAGPPPQRTSGGPKSLTKAQKLARALKGCAKKAKRKRARCRRQAKRVYR